MNFWCCGFLNHMYHLTMIYGVNNCITNGPRPNQVSGWVFLLDPAKERTHNSDFLKTSFRCEAECIVNLTPPAIS